MLNRRCWTGAYRTRTRGSASSPGIPRASTSATNSPSTSSAPTSCASGTRKMPYITEERRMLQEQAHEFTLNEVLPVANKLDPEKGDIPMDLRDKMAELGYFGILIPEKYGGLGLGCSEDCIGTEEVSGGWLTAPPFIPPRD